MFLLSSLLSISKAKLGPDGCSLFFHFLLAFYLLVVFFGQNLVLVLPLFSFSHDLLQNLFLVDFLGPTAVVVAEKLDALLQNFKHLAVVELDCVHAKHAVAHLLDPLQDTQACTLVEVLAVAIS